MTTSNAGMDTDDEFMSAVSSEYDMQDSDNDDMSGVEGRFFRVVL